MRDNFVGTSSWVAIFIILFGIVLGVIPSNFTSWFAFTFFCVVGFLAFAWTVRKSK